mgnify:CR=1 FL=1
MEEAYYKMHIYQYKLYYFRSTLSVFLTWTIIVGCPLLLVKGISYKTHITSLLAIFILYCVFLLVFMIFGEALKSFVVSPLILGRYARHIKGRHEEIVLSLKDVMRENSFSLTNVSELLVPIKNIQAEHLLNLLNICRQGDSDIIYAKDISSHRRQIEHLMDELIDLDFKKQ